MSSAVRHMVALGSSFAAGPGIAPAADRAAGRSARNSPALIAEALGAELTDATVSGATTATILDTAQRVRLRRFAPQIEAVGPEADLVTVTAGGNDLGYIGGMLRTALRHRLGRMPLARRIPAAAAPDAAQVAAATSGLQRIVAEVRRRAPGARVVLVDYLPVLGEHAAPAPAVPFTSAEIALFRATAAQLSAAFAEASRATGADLVPASAFEPGHGLGSADPWVLGLQRGRGRGAAFHPTDRGMRGVADAVLAVLR